MATAAGTHSAAGSTNSVQQQSVVIPVWPQRQVPELGDRCLRISSSTTFLFGNIPVWQQRERYHGFSRQWRCLIFFSSTVWRTLLSCNRDRSPSGLYSCFHRSDPLTILTCPRPVQTAQNTVEVSMCSVSCSSGCRFRYRPLLW